MEVVSKLCLSLIGVAGASASVAVPVTLQTGGKAVNTIDSISGGAFPRFL